MQYCRQQTHKRPASSGNIVYRLQAVAGYQSAEYQQICGYAAAYYWIYLQFSVCRPLHVISRQSIGRPGVMQRFIIGYTYGQ